MLPSKSKGFKLELIKYLNDHFYSKQELLEVSKVSECDFKRYQDDELMPQASYKLMLNVSSDSFFGLYTEDNEIEYYAKGYASWLGVIQSLQLKEKVYSVFATRYRNTIESLKAEGHESANEKINSNLSFHIEEEWTHFINGIYGLCTKSGLPEDIASKEFAIIEINELTETPALNEEEIQQLTLAVNLLDSASSMFAPHERLKSSRHRLINEVRRKYQLKNQ